MKKVWLLFFSVSMGCSSVSLVEHWKTPDRAAFTADKVLVIGMAQNEKARSEFETKLKKEFTKRGVEAERSIDLFEDEFTQSKKTEDELAAFESWLGDQGFDAILLTKVTGSETKQSFRKGILELDGYYGIFYQDYGHHQDIYFERDYYDEFKVYHAETSLYCICSEQQRALLWKGAIDITDPIDVEASINDYIKLIVVALSEQHFIFNTRDSNEVTGL